MHKKSSRLNSKFLGEEARIGSIAAGKQADLMVVKGNPAANILDIEKVEIVFKDGVGYGLRMLGFNSRAETDAFLKQAGAYLDYTEADLERALFAKLCVLLCELCGSS